MAPKLTFKRPSYRGWTFVLILGIVLATVALIERGGVDEVRAADGSTGCQVEVTTDQLNVRAGPAQEAELVGTLARGELHDATTIVTDGFRELEDGTFVADQFLTPVPGTACG